MFCCCYITKWKHSFTNEKSVHYSCCGYLCCCADFLKITFRINIVIYVEEDKIGRLLS